jgi:hypothetical protein
MALYIGSKTPRVFASKKADPVVQHNPLILLRPPAPEKYWMSEECPSTIPEMCSRRASGISGANRAGSWLPNSFHAARTDYRLDPVRGDKRTRIRRVQPWFHSELFDFVLEDSAGRIVGIKVKAAASVTRQDFGGLQRLSTALRMPSCTATVVFKRSSKFLSVNTCRYVYIFLRISLNQLVPQNLKSSWRHLFLRVIVPCRFAISRPANLKGEYDA